MNQPLDDFFPWDEKAAMDEWPQGVFQARVIYAEDGVGSQSGKRMPRVGFQCEQPVEWAHLTHFENYTVGTDEAPTAIVKGTRGYSNLMKLALAAQVPQTGKLSDLFISLKDARLLIAMSYKPDADYKNNIANYFRLGERPVGIAPNQPIAKQQIGGAPGGMPQMGGVPGQAPAPIMPGTPTASMPGLPGVPTPGAPAMPQMQQPSPVQAPMQPPAQPVAAPQPAAPPPPQQAAPQPIAQSQAAPAPQQAPAPQMNPAQQMPTPSAPAPTMSSAPTVHCTRCKQDIPAPQYREHMQMHMNSGT